MSGEMCQDNLKVLTSKYGICVIGYNKVGKSSLIFNYVHEKVEDNIDNEDVYPKRIYNDKLRQYESILLYDSNFGREDMFSGSQRRPIENATTLAFVYSVTDIDSFNAVEEYYNGVRLFLKSDQFPPFVIIGTKSDLVDERRVYSHDGQTLADKLGALAFHECSAMKNEHVQDCFQELVNHITSITEQQQASRRKSDALEISANLSRESSKSLFYVPTIDEANNDHYLDLDQNQNQDPEQIENENENKNENKNKSQDLDQKKRTTSKLDLNGFLKESHSVEPVANISLSLVKSKNKPTLEKKSSYSRQRSQSIRRSRYSDDDNDESSNSKCCSIV
ncbi:hypothetical protein PVL30_003508 [Lodderomyces elongisporus]|uniref:uncharacterized protein n=1 Tax=Lodderomyces elongisporus TaxID=36914 RepID=UPI00291F9988|nr:uncharacterized protein PVL30_003508 [Lodderomyces elongisporus]WLF79744.1 hypothetical protein PVL30_003508 [Lodderomyces elongisporus]